MKNQRTVASNINYQSYGEEDLFDEKTPHAMENPRRSRTGGNNFFPAKFSIPMTWALLSLGSMDGGRSLSYRETMASSFYPIEKVAVWV